MTEHPEPRVRVDEGPEAVEAKLAEIRERVDQAREGPWVLMNGWGPHDDGLHRVTEIANTSDPDPVLRTVLCRSDDAGTHPKRGDIAARKADLKFMALARTDIPWLLDIVDRLKAENERQRALIERLQGAVRTGEWERP